MGRYLNSPAAYMAYERMAKNPYFVDKTGVLEEIISLAENYNSYICITRPRRFGKTVIANMLSAFLSRGLDGGELFDSMEIHKRSLYSEYLNQYQVIRGFPLGYTDRSL